MRNQVIHVFCIPQIMFSLFGLLQFWQWSIGFENTLFSINFALLFTVGVSVLYVSVDKVCGVSL